MRGAGLRRTTVIANEHPRGSDYDFVIGSNIPHWNSTKCERVTRSVLASELYGTVGGFDSAVALTDTINRATSTLGLPKVSLVIYTDT